MTNTMKLENAREMLENDEVMQVSYLGDYTKDKREQSRLLTAIRYPKLKNIPQYDKFLDWATNELAYNNDQ